MENVQGLNKTWATMHCGTASGGPCNETTGLGNSTACPNSTCQSGFHTYTMEWDRSVSPEAIRFSVDGTVYQTVTAAQMDATTWANATNHGFFVILNVAMGGGFPGAFGGGPTSATEPGHPMVVDYVQVLQSSGGGGSTPRRPATGTRTARSRRSRTTASPASRQRRPRTAAAARTSAASRTATGRCTRA